MPDADKASNLTRRVQVHYQPPRTWQDFERLCIAIFKAEFGASECQKIGREGQPQGGVDFYLVQEERGRRIAIQCKLRNDSGVLTKGDVASDLSRATDVQPKLNEYIIATSARRDAAFQELIRLASKENLERGLFTIRVYFWDDLLDLLNSHEQVAAEFCGPGPILAEAFLGAILNGLSDFGELPKENKTVQQLLTAQEALRENRIGGAVTHILCLFRPDLGNLNDRQIVFVDLLQHSLGRLIWVIVGAAAGALATTTLHRYKKAIESIENDRKELDLLHKKSEQWTRKHAAQPKLLESFELQGVDRLKTRFIKCVRKENLDFPFALVEILDHAANDIERDLLIAGLVDMREDGKRFEDFIWQSFHEILMAVVNDNLTQAGYMRLPRVGVRCAGCSSPMEWGKTPQVVHVAGKGAFVGVVVDFEFCQKCKRLSIDEMKIRPTTVGHESSVSRRDFLRYGRTGME